MENGRESQMEDSMDNEMERSMQGLTGSCSYHFDGGFLSISNTEA